MLYPLVVILLALPPLCHLVCNRLHYTRLHNSVADRPLADRLPEILALDIQNVMLDLGPRDDDVAVSRLEPDATGAGD